MGHRWGRSLYYYSTTVMTVAESQTSAAPIPNRLKGNSAMLDPWRRVLARNRDFSVRKSSIEGSRWWCYDFASMLFLVEYSISGAVASGEEKKSAKGLLLVYWNILTRKRLSVQVESCRGPDLKVGRRPWQRFKWVYLVRNIFSLKVSALLAPTLLLRTERPTSFETSLGAGNVWNTYFYSSHVYLQLFQTPSLTYGPLWDDF
jgi:hypothetical protein